MQTISEMIVHLKAAIEKWNIIVMVYAEEQLIRNI
jgi:hypothetical protein